MAPGRPRGKKLSDFGRRLRATIEASDYASRAAFLRAMGMDPAQVYRYETGERDAPSSLVRDFAEALGVTVGELLGAPEPDGVEEEWVDSTGWLELEEAGIVDAYRAKGIPEDQIEYVRRTPGWKGGGRAEDYRRLLDGLLVAHVSRTEHPASAAARERRKGKPDLSNKLP